MTGFFISKKQKKMMKDRRRKKKLGETGQLAPSPSSQQLLDSAIIASKKRPRPAVDFNDQSKTVEEQSTSSSSSLTATAVITIPANLSAKQAKKFRKDARRQARAEGRDEAQLQFVVEGQEVAPQQQQQQQEKKKPKRSFPSINELLKQEKLEQQQRDKVQKEDDLSDDYKAKYVALDCEMVGIGSDGKKSALARVSMVDWWGQTLLDTFVKCPTKVTDFRTFVSGVKPKHIQSDQAMDVTQCRETVSALLKDKILVGHALKNDLHALMLQHPVHRMRDTAKYRPFQRYHKKWRPRKLRDLVKEHCDLVIQQAGEAHDSVDDAKATMRLFQTVHVAWEKELELNATKKQQKNSKR